MCAAFYTLKYYSFTDFAPVGVKWGLQDFSRHPLHFTARPSTPKRIDRGTARVAYLRSMTEMKGNYQLSFTVAGGRLLPAPRPASRTATCDRGL